MKFVVKLNVFFFILYFFLFYFGWLVDSWPFFRIAKSVLLTSSIVVLPAINLTILIQFFIKRKLDSLEFFSIATATGLTVIPFVLSFVHSQFGILTPLLPLINSIIIFLALIFFSRSNASEINLPKLSHHFLALLTSFPSILILLIYVVVIGLIGIAYYPLPDLDPYYWISTYSTNEFQNTITHLTGYRPLFSSLIYILHIGGKFDLYAIFKFILPQLSTLIIIPALLVANKYKSLLIKSIFLLSAFVSASTFLYLQLPIPQALMLILTFYILFFLIYSSLVSDNHFFYAGGIIAFFSFFYHEATAIIIIIYLLALLLFDGKRLVKFIASHKIESALIGLLLILNVLPLTKHLFLVIWSWAQKLMSVIPGLQFNFLFPSYYVNIDGNQMGWSGLIGVARYYGYYSGIFSLLIIGITLTIILGKKDYRQLFINKISTDRNYFVLFFSFMVFFTISEILPRMFSLAFLPERSWNFVGIFSISFFSLFIFFFQNKFRFFYLLLLVGLMINIGGSFYINNSKKYIITENQLRSAEWIKTNLPSNRLILSSSGKNLLKFHAQSEMGYISPKSYFDESTLNQELSRYNISQDIKTTFSQFLEQTEAHYKNIKKSNIEIQSETIRKAITSNIAASNLFLTELKNFQTGAENQKPLYIYYSKDDKRNPYIHRPYYGQQPDYNEFIFDQKPEKYERVYAEKDNIIIWKVL